jgi:hypothetical protein
MLLLALLLLLKLFEVGVGVGVGVGIGAQKAVAAPAAPAAFLIYLRRCAVLFFRSDCCCPHVAVEADWMVEGGTVQQMAPAGTAVRGEGDTTGRIVL